MAKLYFALLCVTLLKSGLTEIVEYSDDTFDKDKTSLEALGDYGGEIDSSTGTEIRSLDPNDDDQWLLHSADSRSLVNEWKRNLQQRITPNSFSFPLMGKRGQFNPNTFLFPLSSGKRTMINAPRPNGFLFPHGKRSYEALTEGTDKKVKQITFNAPRPDSFFWPGRGRRHDQELVHKANLIRPNGFVFTMKGKRDSENSVPSDEKYPFFAGRGRRQDTYDAFMAGRGKRGKDSDVDNFFAGRGKKANNFEEFIAGRG